MERKGIVFTQKNTAEFLTINDLPEVGAHDVLVRMEYTVVSGGTERACITGAPNTSGQFPQMLGYCGIGRVREVGSDVQSVKAGDRVLVYHGHHATLNVRPEEDVIKVEDDCIDSLEAAFTVIAVMGLGGVRKLELELGESAMVMGLGLLGMFAVKFCSLSGAYPVIAADPDESRRKLALEFGADCAFDPTEKDFAQKVKALTRGGVNGTVEVTGISAAMSQAADCASYMGRISLLGCTRVSDCAIDYYTKVHKTGVKLIGAHNFIRPKYESYPHHWTHRDDCLAVLRLLSARKLDVKPLISRVVSPEEAPRIYDELVNSKFPLGTVFDWREI